MDEGEHEVTKRELINTLEALEAPDTMEVKIPENDEYAAYMVCMGTLIEPDFPIRIPCEYDESAELGNRAKWRIEIKPAHIKLW